MLKFKVFPMLAGAAAFGALALSSSPASADPQIFFGPAGTTSPPGGTAMGGESNLITNTSSFVVGVAGGTFTLQDPLVIIVGVDGNGTPSISCPSCSSITPMPVDTYGLTANTGTLTSTSTTTVEEALSGGTVKGDGSETGKNWAGADSANGFAVPTNYSLFAFALNGISLSSGSPLSIDESGANPGSFMVGYDCEQGTNTGTNGACATNGDRGQTPFTNAGLLVPAPVIGHGLPVLLAFGGILLGARLLGRKRLSTGTAVPHGSVIPAAPRGPEE